MKQRSRQYLLNAILLSVVSVSMRAIGVSYNAYVTKKIGAEGVGLFTLVMSVFTLAVTLATSGVNLAAVRMSSERLALCRAAGAGSVETRKALRRAVGGCICYSLIFGVLAGLLLYILAEPVGKYILCDVRTVSSLRLSAPALPAISLSSALAGYFTGIRKIYKNAIISVGEQFVQISLTSAALYIIAPRGIEYACLSVVGGAALAEGASLLLSFILYITDKGGKSYGNGAAPRFHGASLRRAASIALPVAFGSYIRQGLLCAEHIAIPAGLRKYGGSEGSALASYGVLHGMSLPLILFPASVIGAFTSLLIPELSEYHALGDRSAIRFVSERCVSFGVIFSVAVGGIFLAYGNDLGMALYSSSEAGKYIAAFAPLVPVMYLDTAVDAVLKGTEQQLYCMKVNILDAFLSLILVLLLVPRVGCMGYVICVYITEGVNAALSISKMISVTRPRISPSSLILPPVFIFLSVCISRVVSAHFYIGTAGEIALCLFIYSALLLCKNAFFRPKSYKTEKAEKVS